MISMFCRLSRGLSKSIFKILKTVSKIVIKILPLNSLGKIYVYDYADGKRALRRL